MKSKKLVVILVTLTALVANAMPAFALTSDLQYKFKTENKDEFYKRGQMNLNVDGPIPDFLLDIYDFTPQPVQNSDFGANITLPASPIQNNTTNAPRNAPSSAYIQSPAGLATGGLQGNQTADSGQNTDRVQGQGGGFYQPTSTDLNGQPNQQGLQNGQGQSNKGALPGENGGGAYSSGQDGNVSDNPKFPVTPIAEVRNSDGSFGTLNIPKIGLNVTAYDGDTFTAMKKGVGHIASTSAWNSNIGLVGHNRGSSAYFGKLKSLKAGDEMTYATKLGTRTYVVQSVQRINETDWSLLQYTGDNRLTLLTCVEDVPSQRLCVSAIEKK